MKPTPTSLQDPSLDHSPDPSHDRGRPLAFAHSRGGLVLALVVSSISLGSRTEAQQVEIEDVGDLELILEAMQEGGAAEEPSEGSGALPPSGPQPGAEYVGSANPVATAEDRALLAAADEAIREGKWDEAALALSAPPVLEEPAPAGGPRIRVEVARFFTPDGVLFTALDREVASRAAKLPAAAFDVWRKARGETGAEAPAASPEEFAPAETPGQAGPDLDLLSVPGRPDHAALRIPQESEAPAGSYARWVHRLSNFRELRSSVAARNRYYVFFPMQVASLEDIILVRSHQDIVALDRSSGNVLWRVDSDVPVAEQTHQSDSGFDSFRFFTDLGGWSLAVARGEPDRVVVISKAGRARVVNGAISFQPNLLRAYEARTGKASWERGGAADKDEILRGLTFCAPPTMARDAEGEVLAVPATSGEAYHVLGFTAAGDLLWATRLYSYVQAQGEWIDENTAYGASLAASGSTIVGAPGHGLVFAITTRGKPLWQARYPSTVREEDNAPRWAPGHPILSGGKAVFAPFDGDCLFVRDPRTGELAWERRHASGYFSLVGADAERVYTLDMDGRVTASSILDGGTAWVGEKLGMPAGRGIVTSNKIYVAVGRGIVFLDPAKGTVLGKARIWDEAIPSPSPGNLFLSRGDLFLAAPWGFAALEPLDVTWEGLSELPLRQGLLRRARILSARVKHAEAMEIYRQALASAREDEERESLRAEFLELAREAAATTKDLGFLRRVIEDPEALPTKPLRLAFLLRSAEILKSQAPAEAASMYREILEETSPEELVPASEGILADQALHAADALLDLFASGRAAAAEADEEKVKGWIEKHSAEEKGVGRLASIALRYSHLSQAAAAHAFLVKAARDSGDFAGARNCLERMLRDYRHLSGVEELRDLARELSLGARADSWREVSPPALDSARPWSLHASGASEGAELVATAEGSDPFPGILVLDRGGLSLLDKSGAEVRKIPIPGLPDLKAARKASSTVLVEPAEAHFRDGRLLLFTAAGLHEILDISGGDPRVRSWLDLPHPLARYLSPAAGSEGSEETVFVDEDGGVLVQPSTRAARAPEIDDKTNFFPRAVFDPAGSPLVVEPDGTLISLERRTGRISYKSASGIQASAGPPRRSGDHAAVESAIPPGIALHDLKARKVGFLATSSTPWKAILVPSIAVAIDSGEGVEVRDFSSPPERWEADAADLPTLWREEKARGMPSLVHADVSRVVLLEQGERLACRTIRSGRLLWSVQVPDGLSPVRTFVLEGEPGLPADLVLLASRDVDPDDGRGVPGRKIPQQLHAIRVAGDGRTLWQTEVARGGVHCDGACLALGPEAWILAFTQKEASWRTRAVVLHPATGATKELFEQPLEMKANYAPPKMQWTSGGIAVGSFGSWAFFALGPAPGSGPAPGRAQGSAPGAAPGARPDTGPAPTPAGAL